MIDAPARAPARCTPTGAVVASHSIQPDIVSTGHVCPACDAPTVTTWTLCGDCYASMLPHWDSCRACASHVTKTWTLCQICGHRLP